MALQNNMRLCGKSFQMLPKQLSLLTLRALHKSVASEEMSAAEEEALPERLITAANVGRKTPVKSLKEMPGPSTLSNLIEFFWKDGFGRIHEIQVMVPMLLLFPIVSQIKICLCIFCTWQEPVFSQRQPNLPLMRKMAQAVA